MVLFCDSTLYTIPMTSKEPAPSWACIDHEGSTRTSAEFVGSWLLLYFYPKDDTPGCTIEACGFRDAWDRLSSAIQILGVSADPPESHRAFREKFSLPFTLLSDTEGLLRSAFQADGSVYPKRVTFLINPSGHIEKVYEGFDCQTHTGDIDRDLVSLRVLTA